MKKYCTAYLPVWKKADLSRAANSNYYIYFVLLLRCSLLFKNKNQLRNYVQCPVSVTAYLQ